MPDVPPDSGKGSAPGFELTPKLVLAQAEDLEASAASLLRLVKSLRPLGGGLSAVFGEGGAPEAYYRFASGLADEIYVQFDALEELARKLRRSVNNYEFMDEIAAAAAQGVITAIGAPGSAADPQGSGLLGRVGQVLDGLTILPGSRPG